MRDAEADGTGAVLARDAGRAWTWLAPLLLAPALLAGCWNAPFFGLDDGPYLAREATLQPGHTWSELWQPDRAHNFYYPLTLHTWRFDRWLWGAESWPAGIRIGNLLFHALAGVWLFALLRRLKAAPALAAFVACAFVLHPAACECVCWPIERKTVLAGFLGMGALYCYVRAPRWLGGTGLLSTLLFAAALMSKPSALGLLPVVVVWELFGRPGFEPTQKTVDDPFLASRWSAIWRLAPWVACAAGGTAIGYAMHGVNVMAPPGGSLYTALLTDVPILSRYFLNLAWPGALSAYYYVEPVTTPASGRFVLHAAAVLAVVGGTVALAMPARRRLAAFAWLWFLGALGPHLNLLALNDLMHDRFMYFAMPGFWLAVGLAVEGLWRRMPVPQAARGRPTLAALSLGMLAVFWSVGSAQRSALWADAQAVWQEAVIKEPQSSYAHLLLANEWRNDALLAADEGNREGYAQAITQAESHLREGILAPDFDRYRAKLAARTEYAYLLLQKGHLDEARAVLEPGLKNLDEGVYGQPQLFKALLTAGLIDLRAGDGEAALRKFDTALHADPHRTLVHYHRGEALTLQARRKEAAGEAGAARALMDQARAAYGQVRPEDPTYRNAQAALRGGR